MNLYDSFYNALFLLMYKPLVKKYKLIDSENLEHIIEVNFQISLYINRRSKGGRFFEKDCDNQILINRFSACPRIAYFVLKEFVESMGIKAESMRTVIEDAKKAAIPINPKFLEVLQKIVCISKAPAWEGYPGFLGPNLILWQGDWDSRLLTGVLDGQVYITGAKPTKILEALKRTYEIEWDWKY